MEFSRVLFKDEGYYCLNAGGELHPLFCEEAEVLHTNGIIEIDQVETRNNMPDDVEELTPEYTVTWIFSVSDNYCIDDVNKTLNRH